MSLAQVILQNDAHKVAQFLQQQDVDVNEMDEYGYPPIIESAIVNNTEIAQLLIHHGADVNLQDMTGRSALHWAVDNSNQQLAQLLLKEGADPNCYTIASQPILVQPLLRHQRQLSELLQQYGGDIEFARDYINTKLLGHRFQLQGMVDIVNHRNAFIEISYEGFILEFSLQVIVDSLSRYLNHFQARHLRAFFPQLNTIQDRLSNAAELIRYQHFSIDRDKRQDRIDELLNTNPTIIPIAYEGHAISFIKLNQLWARCDRGEFGRQHGCINIYKAYSKLTSDYFYHLLYTKHSRDYVENKIDQELQLKPITQIPIQPQQTGNCSWANIEAAIPTLLFLLMNHNSFQNNQPIQAHTMEKSLDIYYQWQEWDRDRALEDCIQSFHRTNSKARKASKAAVLGAILVQQCHYQSFKNIKRAEKILSVLTLPNYRYVLEHYAKTYCYPKMTPAGENLLELFEDCGIDPGQFNV